VNRFRLPACFAAALLCPPAHAATPDPGAATAPAQETGSATPATDPADAAKPTPKRQAGGARRNRVDPSPSSRVADTRARPPPGIFGDWRGIRTAMAGKGVDLTARYGSESGYNVAGGERHRFRETGQFDLSAALDLQQMLGLTGGTFQSTITYRRGYDLGRAAGLGTLQQVQEVYGRGQTFRVTQFWYEQVIGADKAEIKIGLTSPAEDFAAFSCHFQNLSFCGSPPGNLAGDYWYNWPISQWGGRAKINLGKFTVQLGAYEVNPKNLEKDFTLGHFHGATGVLLPVELGWTTASGESGRVGSWKIGGWYTTANAPDVLLDRDRRPIVVTGLSPLTRKGRYGAYINIQQQLTGHAENGKSVNGLSVFLNVTQTDRATSTTDNQVALGLFHKGLIPRVPGDVIGFAVARTNVNGRVARGQLLDPAAPEPQDAEYAAEVYYAIHPWPWLELRPNLQYIHHPGGLHSADNIGVVGMKGAVTL
jgi:porin